MKSLSIHIVQAGINELALLKKIGIQTFTESFASANTKEDMDLYLSNSFNDLILEKELKNPDVHYYLAYSDEIAAGYLKLNFGKAQNEIFDSSLEIERIYVLKQFQNLNIGQELLEKAFVTGRQKKLDLIWLGVWEKNPGAIKFYKRNQFVEFSEHPFMLGKDKQTDVLMKRFL